MKICKEIRKQNFTYFIACKYINVVFFAKMISVKTMNKTSGLFKVLLAFISLTIKMFFFFFDFN